MGQTAWRARAAAPFATAKHPASGRRVIVTNHPLGTAAGVEVFAAGGNAVDAALAALFTLTVVEPMMVGIAGGGICHVRTPDGDHHIIDAMSVAPATTHPTIFTPVSSEPPNHMETVGRRSQLGATSIAVPGNLKGWCALHDAYGKLAFADLLEPAIRHAKTGFHITPYLAGAIDESAADIIKDPAMAKVFLPGGAPPATGHKLVQGAYGECLRFIAKAGAGALHGGPLGDALVERVAHGEGDPGWLSRDDLKDYQAIWRAPIVGSYRDVEIVGPPPPASSGVHVSQMLNILEAFDVAAMGFGTADCVETLANVLAVGMADRAAHSGDPDFVDVPMERLTSKDYGASWAERIKAGESLFNRAAPQPTESHDTTHVTVADEDGLIVSATHTINGIFGAKIMVPGAGFIPNNYMMNFDPTPGRALSVAPRKRVPTSMAPLIVRRGGKPLAALGLPGGIRIFPCAFQAIVNLIDHKMSLQEAVEAPRLWTDGHVVEVEKRYGEAPASALGARGYTVLPVAHIGGGMNAIGFGAEGTLEGAACWRADGTVAALGGGLAREGVRFWPGKVPEATHEATDATTNKATGKAAEND